VRIGLGEGEREDGGLESAGRGLGVAGSLAETADAGCQPGCAHPSRIARCACACARREHGASMGASMGADARGRGRERTRPRPRRRQDTTPPPQPPRLGPMRAGNASHITPLTLTRHSLPPPCFDAQGPQVPSAGIGLYM